MGGGGGKGSQAQTSASRELEAFTGEIRQQSRGTRELLFSQAEEALRTGGVGAQIPSITRAQESSRLATSRALEQIDVSLAQSNLAGTPFGERVRAEALTTGEFATSQIPTQQAASIIQTFPGIASGAAIPIITGLGSAASAQANLGGAQTAAKAQTTAALFGAGGSIGAGKAGG